MAPEPKQAELAAALGKALGEVRGENPAQTLPEFRRLARALEEDSNAWPMAFRGLLYNGGFNAAFAAGRFAEALDFAQREYEAAKAFGESHYSLARSLNNRGLAFLELGELVKAEADFMIALREIAEHKDSGIEGLLPGLEHLIRDHLQILRGMRAGHGKGPTPTTEADGSPERSHQQTLYNILFPDLDVVSKVNFAWSRAEALELAGKSAEAEAMLVAAVQSAKAGRSNPRMLGIALSNLGEHYLRLSNPLATDYLRDAVRTLEEISSPNEPLALALHNLSLALQTEGDWAGAALAAKRAWTEISEAAARSPHSLSILLNLARIRVREGDRARARAILKHALQIYDEARTGYAVSEVDHAGTFGVYRSIVELMLFIALHEQWTDEVHGLIENAKARFMTEALERFTNPQTEKVPLKLTSQGGSIGLDISPNSGREAVHLASYLARPGTLVLSFFVGPNATFVIRSRGRDPSAFRIMLGEEDLRRTVERFYADLQSGSRSQPWRKSGLELGEILFRGVDLAGAEMLLISPDGPLWLVPFDILARIRLSNQPASRTPPAVYQAPSLKIIEELRNIPREVEVGYTAVLFTKSTFASFPALPSSRNMISTFERHLRPAGYRLEILDGEQATVATLATAMVGAAVIHISSHGIAPFDGSDPYVVTDDGVGGEDRITVSTIAALQLRARVVFLSACSSAFGVNSEGEGVVSVARAFLLAGCQSVIAALWMVEEDVTAKIVERFYTAFALGCAPATALREAKAELLEGGRTQTAAAFQIYGDGESEMTMSELLEIKRVEISREGLSS